MSGLGRVTPAANPIRPWIGPLRRRWVFVFVSSFSYIVDRTPAARVQCTYYIITHCVPCTRYYYTISYAVPRYTIYFVRSSIDAVTCQLNCVRLQTRLRSLPVVFENDEIIIVTATIIIYSSFGGALFCGIHTARVGDVKYLPRQERNTLWKKCVPKPRILYYTLTYFIYQFCFA